MDALLLCPMDLAASGYFPGRAKFLDKTIKRVTLGPRALEPSSDVSVDEVCSGKGVFKARVLLTKTSVTGHGSIDWFIAAPFSKPGGLSGSLNPCLDFQFRHVGSFGSLPAVDPPGMYSICQHKLDVAVITVDGEQSYQLPKRLAKDCLSTTAQRWQLVNEERIASKDTGRVIVACHFTRVQRPSQSLARLRGLAEDTGQQNAESAGDKAQSEYDEEEEADEEFNEEELDEDEEDSESKPGSETEGDSSGIESSRDVTEPESNTVTDVLVIAREQGNPIWIPCHGGQKTRREMGGALHPSEPVFVWAQDAESLTIMNTVSGKTTTSSLSELPKGDDDPLLPQAEFVDKEQIPTLRTHFGSRLLREIRFSPDGSLMHALFVNFKAASSHLMEATVSLVRFRFEAGKDTGNEDPRLEQFGGALTASYLFYKKVDDLPVPLGVTYWCSDAVYICIPLLTCSVKFIKMLLNPSASDKSQSKLEQTIQTLNRTILIPSSTSQRRPRLLYQRAAKSKPDDSLYLVLGPEPKLDTPSEAEDRKNRHNAGCCSEQCDHEDMTSCDHMQEEFGRGGASIIRWNVPREGGWRDWDPEKDSLSDELKRKLKKRSLCTFNELRGTFIDTDKMFSVPIRGFVEFQLEGIFVSWLKISLKSGMEVELMLEAFVNWV